MHSTQVRLSRFIERIPEIPLDTVRRIRLTQISAVNWFGNLIGARRRPAEELASRAPP